MDGWIFQMLQDWRNAKRFEGGLLHGPDLSQWPALTFDVFSIFAFEDGQIESAKFEVDHINRSL